MLRIGICDDDPAMLEELEKRIHKYLEIKNIKYIQYPFQSAAHLLKADPLLDILFLDIRMEGINGMDAARILRKQGSRCHIVFVTALKEYVLDAFDVNAENYLIKPVEDIRFCSTMDRILSQIGQEEEVFLSYHYNGRYLRIPYKDICYCEVFDHDVTLYTIQGIHKYNQKIEQLERIFDSRFFRCHRSYIVNLEKVSHYQQGILTLDSGEQIPVAKRRQPAFLQALLCQQRKEVR